MGAPTLLLIGTVSTGVFILTYTIDRLRGRSNLELLEQSYRTQSDLLPFLRLTAYGKIIVLYSLSSDTACC